MNVPVAPKTPWDYMVNELHRNVRKELYPATTDVPYPRPVNPYQSTFDNIVTNDMYIAITYCE